MTNNSSLQKGKVVGISMTLKGVTVGSCNENPKLKSIVCDVEFYDGQVKGRAANAIAENMMTRVES